MNDLKRKLAAIMFTDIVGFTALSSIDEEKALTIIDKQREILQPIVKKFNGEWLKEIGDGLLLSFPSSKQAVHCAIEIQNTVKEIDFLNLRIGIHQGDILEKGGDIFGDDVNIASRMEPFAASGGVAVSQKVAGDISGSPEFKLKYIGTPDLKGVTQKLKIYCIISHGLPETKRSGISAKLKKKEGPRLWYALPVLFLIFAAGLYFFPEKSAEINSIAVLPLDNLSNDPEQEYFVDGMTDALIMELSRIKALKVISRTSIKQYKNADKSLPEIARELNVDAVVSGSVFLIDGRVRISTQLIEAKTDRNLWAQNYDRDLNDVLVLHSDVARAIASAIKITVTPEEEILLANKHQIDPEVYENYLKGKSYLDKFTREATQKSVSYFNRAIEKDPDYAPAYLGLAQSRLMYINMNVGSTTDNYNEFKTLTMKAIELDPTLSNAFYSLGRVKLYFDWDLHGAEADFKRALDLNPNSVETLNEYAILLMCFRRFDEGIEMQNKAMELNPLSHYASCNTGFSYLGSGDYEKAIKHSHKTTDDFGSSCAYEQLVIGRANIQLGSYAKGIAAMEKGLNISNGNPRFMAGLAYAHALNGQTDKAENIMKELQSMSSETSYFRAIIHVGLNNYDTAFRLFDEAYANHDYLYLWVNADPRVDPVRQDPRFKAMLKKLNL